MTFWGLYFERRLLYVILNKIMQWNLWPRTIYNATGRNLKCNPTLGRLKTYYLIPLHALILKYILPDFTHVTVHSALKNGENNTILIKFAYSLIKLLSQYISKAENQPFLFCFLCNVQALHLNNKFKKALMSGTPPNCTFSNFRGLCSMY